MQLGRQHKEDRADGHHSWGSLPRHMPLLFRHPPHVEVDFKMPSKDLNQFSPLQEVEQEVAAAGRVRVLRLAVLSTVLAPDVSSRVVCVRTTSCEVQEGDQEGKTGTRNDNNGGEVGKKGKV